MAVHMNDNKKKKFCFDTIFQNQDFLFDIQDNVVHGISRRGTVDVLESLNIPLDCLSKCSDLEWYNFNYDKLCRTEVEGQ
eukprot:5667562-Ditylum_brightwellii.AAC.1